MANSNLAMVKCLNTEPGRKHFVFKSFSQRVSDIDIGVFRSLDPIKSEPSIGSSFFLQCLKDWKELNIAEDFITFHEQMMPLVQTLPQIILHKDLIFTKLINQLKIEAKLSLEPILMLIAALSRDILEDFIPFLERLINSIIYLLEKGGDRDPDILEQVFTSLSYIVMHLQKYLVKDIIYILNVTKRLRFYTKDYVRDFMAQIVSFLLRNAQNSQLYTGLEKVVLEITKKPSEERKDGVIALLFHVMKGTSNKLHSKAEKTLNFLLDESTICKYPNGSSYVIEVITGVLNRLCTKVDQNELGLIYTCLFNKIKNSIKYGLLVHLNYLIGLLSFALNITNRNKSLDKEGILNIVELLINKFISPNDEMRNNKQLSQVIESILNSLLILLNVTLINSDILRVLSLYAPVFQLRTPSLLNFIKELVTKNPQISHNFEGHIISSIAYFSEKSPDQGTFILIKYLERETKPIFDNKLLNFFNEMLLSWTQILNNINNLGEVEISEDEVALFYGVIKCYYKFDNLQDGPVIIRNLISSLDQLLLSTESDIIAGISRSTWQSVIGAALASYNEFISSNNYNNHNNNEVVFFLSLAERNKSSPKLLSAVSELLYYFLGEKSLQDECDLDILSAFIGNLSSSNKENRISTLRILSHIFPKDSNNNKSYYYNNEERPNKRLKSEETNSEIDDVKCTNVVELFLSIETTPLCIFTSHKLTYQISRIQSQVSSRRFPEKHMQIVLHGILGVLHNRFSQLWDPALELLSVLIRDCRGLVWGQFVEYFDTCQKKAIKKYYLVDDDVAIQKDDGEITDLVKYFKQYLNLESDPTPCATIVIQLLKCLHKVSDISESKSRQIIPLFFNFLGYNNGNIQSVESYSSNECKGKDWRAILKEWLNLIKSMHNSKSLYQSNTLHEVLVKRLLDDVDSDIQVKVLGCLLNFKDDFLVPYYTHLKNLAASETVQQELTNWSVSKESNLIQNEHRAQLVPLIIRILTPKVRNFKSLGTHKHAGPSNRKALIRFFMQFDPREIELFFSLLLKPLLSDLEKPFEIAILEISNCINGNDNNISFKRINGFLHVFEDLIGTFGICHIGKFLNNLMMIVVLILENCMKNIIIINESDEEGNDCMKSDNEDMEDFTSINQFMELRTICLNVISLTLNKFVNYEFSSEFWDIFFKSIGPMVNSFNLMAILDDIKKKRCENKKLNRKVKKSNTKKKEFKKTKLNPKKEDKSEKLNPTKKGDKREKKSKSFLFKCFLAMSKNPKLVQLLLKQSNLVTNIFSILSVSTAADAVIFSVLEFADNLLSLDLYEKENNNLNEVILPEHIDVLVKNLHDLYELKRTSVVLTGKRELRILKMLVNYIKDPTIASNFLDILLSFLRMKEKISDEYVKEGLLVVQEMVPILGFKKFNEVLKAINPLLFSAGLELRHLICEIINGLADRDSTFTLLAKLMQDLNAESKIELGELDYDSRIKAYDSIRPHLFSQLREHQTLTILSHCVYDMSSDKLIFRQSASRALQSFLHFAAPILNTGDGLVGEHDDMVILNEDGRTGEDGATGEDGLNGDDDALILTGDDHDYALVSSGEEDDAMMILTGEDGSTGEEDEDDDLILRGDDHALVSSGEDDDAMMILTGEDGRTGEDDDGAGSWRKGNVMRIIDGIYLRHIGDAMSKDISIQKEWFVLLRVMVYNFENHQTLSSLKSLCSEDPDHDFFINIVHLQIDKRAKALSLFRKKISTDNFSLVLIKKIFVPLVFNMLFEIKEIKEHVKNACIETLASIAAHVEWKAYRIILTKAFKELNLKPNKQKVILRLICGLLDSFHFYEINPQTEERVLQDQKQVIFEKLFLKAQKLFALDLEKVNVNISIVCIKILKILPSDKMEAQLSNILHKICTFLKNRLESIRGDARSALAACLKELGFDYLLFIVKILRTILKRGYELHVLGYTLHFLLSKGVILTDQMGQIDYCLDELLEIIDKDIFGEVSEEKDVDKIASKMKETKKSMSYETLRIISNNISFKTHAIKIISHVCARFSKHLNPRLKGKIEMALHNISLGLESNISAETPELFVFVFGLIQDTITEDSNSNSNSNSNLNLNLSLNSNWNLITNFALGLFCKRLKKLKGEKNILEILSMLDPFIPLLTQLLNSKYENIMSSSFKCLSHLITLPLPSLDFNADKIKNSLLDISQKSNNSNNTLMRSCLKLLSVLLNNTRVRVSIDEEELKIIVNFPVFIDLQKSPSQVALSLLKAIIKRKLVVPEIYDLVTRVSELMVTCQDKSIRINCSQILLKFLLDYKISEKRLQQHLDFLLSNLSYEHSSGRESVLEMLHIILIKFPKSILDNQAQTFFIHLVAALSNDNDIQIHSMVKIIIKELIEGTNENVVNNILEFCISWYTCDNRNLWSPAAQVFGLLQEAKKGFKKQQMETILTVSRNIMQSALGYKNEITKVKNELIDEINIPFWKEAYYSVSMLEKIFSHPSEMFFKPELDDIWILVTKFLIHPYTRLQEISTHLISSYFASVLAIKKEENNNNKNKNKKSDNKSLILLNPSRIFLISVSLISQLKTENLERETETNNLILQNLLFLICKLNLFSRERNPVHFWSEIGSKEQSCFIEGFKLLGSRKAENNFYLNVTLNEEKNEKDKLRSLLVAPLIKRMAKIAMQMGDLQMEIVFKTFEAIVLELGKEDSLIYIHHIFFPIYKVCEDFAGKIITDGMKQLAGEVRDKIRDIIGVDNFVQIYNQIRKSLKKKRDNRRQFEKVLAVLNPMRHAKKKLRIAAKHKAHKKKKIFAMKIGKWKR